MQHLNIPLPNRKLFTSNVLICLAIALLIYFFLQTPFLQWTFSHLVKLLFNIYFVLLQNKAYLTLSMLSLGFNFSVLMVCACIWTYQKTVLRRIASTAVLGLLLISAAFCLSNRSGMLIISLLIVIGVSIGIVIDAVQEFLSNQFNRKIVEEKHDAEYNILRHLNHNLRPNIQMVKSPISAVLSFMETRGLLGEPVAKRLDGSNETVGEALRNAVISLGHITDILESTRQLVTHEIRQEDFQEVEICSLLRQEVIPIYSAKLHITIQCNNAITMRLHRQSFVEAMHNIIRNAETHAFQGECRGSELLIVITERRSKVVLDYTNNGRRFPENLTEKDFLSFGKKSNDSPGEGLGGAWIGKMIAAHNGSFEIIRDEQPLHFRIVLPKGGI